MKKPKVAFILGDGYSGSTLLDLILGSHSRMLSLGEIDSFDTFLEQNHTCTCFRSQRDCTFWQEVLRHLSELTGSDSFRLKPPAADERVVLNNTLNLFRAAQAVSSAEVLSDSTKRFQRARKICRSGLVEAKVIHLLRDGRGVAFSHLKRGESFEDAVLYWKATNLAIRDWLQSGEAPDGVTIRYEDFCAQPSETVRQVCGLLGLDWEPQMMMFAEKEHHNVSGNIMRFKLDSSIKKDEEWKHKLGAENLSLFERLAGSASRELGY